jgi:PAS domain S-box-containing protein
MFAWICDPEGMAMRTVVAVPDAASFGTSKPTITRLGQGDAVAKKLQSIAGVGIWRYDYALDLVTWSNEEFRIFGVSPDTFQPTFANFLTLVHPDDREAMLAANKDAGLGNPMDFEHRIVRPDGEMRYVREQAQIVIRDELGGHPILIGTTQDITARKGAELRASTQGCAQERLSPRERATLIQIVNGASNKEAARALGISPRTVEFHRANIMRKLDAGNLAELVAIVLGAG